MTFDGTLRGVMKRRGMSQAALAKLAGLSVSAVQSACGGKRMPGMRTVGLLAQALEAPELVREAAARNTRTCEECGTIYVRERGGRFCRETCRHRWHSRLLAAKRRERRPDLLLSLSAQNAILRNQLEQDRAELAATQAIIDAFCHECEPEGLCRIPPCKMRARSPLPLASARLRLA